MTDTQKIYKYLETSVVEATDHSATREYYQKKTYREWAWQMVREYLDEKGVEFHSGMRSVDPPILCGGSFVFFSVPTKLYHEVVIPGFREVCKKVHMKHMPVHYDVNKEDNTRSIEFKMDVDWTKVTQAELETHEDNVMPAVGMVP